MKPLRKCAFCGEPIYGSNRWKYCSDECYFEAHKIQCRERYRRIYALHRERELERNRRYYAAQKAKEACS